MYFPQSRSHIVDDAQRETALVVQTETQTHNRQLIFSRTRQDDKPRGGKGGGGKVEGEEVILLGRMIYESSSCVTSHSLLGFPSWLQHSLYSCTLDLSIYPLIHSFIPSSLEFSTLSSPVVHPLPLFISLHSYHFLFFLHHHIHSFPLFFPHMAVSFFLTVVTLNPPSPSPLRADLPRSMVGYLTGLLLEDSTIECESPGWEEEGKKRVKWY